MNTPIPAITVITPTELEAILAKQMKREPRRPESESDDGTSLTEEERREIEAHTNCASKRVPVSARGCGTKQ